MQFIYYSYQAAAKNSSTYDMVKDSKFVECSLTELSALIHTGKKSQTSIQHNKNRLTLLVYISLKYQQNKLVLIYNYNYQLYILSHN